MSIVLLVPLVGLLVGLVLSAFFSGAETGVYTLNRLRLRVRAAQQQPRATLLARLMERPEELVITTLLGTNIADYLTSASLTAMLVALVGGGEAEVLATLIGTPLVLIFGGIIPKDWFQRDADRLMYGVAPALLVCKRGAQLTGLVGALRGLTRGLIRMIDPSRAVREEDLLPRTRMLRQLREGAASGGLSVFQRDLIERVLNVSHVRVSQVMIARERAAIVAEDISREDFLRIARMAHFSRLPMHARGNSGRVVGIVNVYDVITDERPRAPWEYRHEPLRLAADERVPAALLKLQETRQAMAIVEDGRGQCIGILTVKDLVEEIVGELEVW